MSSTTETRLTHVVGAADMRVGMNGELLVTHALGSCLGLTVYDPVAGVGGLLRAMLPTSRINPDKAKTNPAMFVDTGVPALLEAVYAMGALKPRLVVKAAGCASPMHVGEFFKIGERNYAMLRKILEEGGILIAAEETGGTASRTVHLDLETGVVKIRSAGREWEL